MAVRDLTEKFLEFRTRIKTFTQLERWTVDNNMDDALSTKCLDSSECVGLEQKDSLPVEAATQWLACVSTVETHCAAVECELRRMTALHQQRLLVTFNASQEEAANRDLQDVTAMIQKRLGVAQAALSAETHVWSDVSGESNASRSLRINARKSLAKRLHGLGDIYRSTHREYSEQFARHCWQRGFGRNEGNMHVDSQDAKGLRSRMVHQSWERIEDDLSFLTEGTEHRALKHFRARRPGECALSLEEITQLEESTVLAAERDDGIERLSRSVADVAHIFKELAVLVIDQGTVLDRCAPRL